MREREGEIGTSEKVCKMKKEKRSCDEVSAVNEWEKMSESYYSKLIYKPSYVKW